MRIKSVIVSLLLTVVSITTVKGATYDELAQTVPTTRDFTFGLPKTFTPVTSLETDDTGYGTWLRFLDLKQQLPDEIPIFKPYEVKGKIQLFVSNDGNDDNPGTIDKPFKTLEKAMAVAGMTKDRTGGLVIYLREGIYDATKGINIPQYISGGKSNPIFISNYNDEKVIMNGGFVVQGKDLKVADDERANRLLPENSKGRVYSVNLRELGYTELPETTVRVIPALTIDGNSYQMARYPNNSRVEMFEYKGEGAQKGVLDIGPVSNGLGGNKVTEDDGRGFEFVPADNRAITWENDEHIWMHGSFGTEYAEGNKRIHTVRKLDNDLIAIRTFDHEGYGAMYSKHSTHYYYNVMEELDVPGEWYMDYNTGILYVYPLGDISDSTLEIAMTDKTLMSFEYGTNNVVINGISFMSGLSKGIDLNGNNNVIQNCRFSNLGSAAVSFGKAYQCGVTCCTAENTKGMNIMSALASQSDGTLQSNLSSAYCFVQNCYVVNGGSINIGQNGGNIASHNTVINANQAFSVQRSYGNIVEYNEGAGVPISTSDTGVIYVEGAADCIGNHVRYNFFHDSIKSRGDPFGIYFDDMSSFNLAYGNILKNCNIFWHGGSNNVAYNNLIMESGSFAIRDSANYSGGDVGVHGIFSNQYLAYNGYRTNFDKEGYTSANSIAWASQYPSISEWITGLIDFRYRASEHLKTQSASTYVKTQEDKEFLYVKRNVYKNNATYDSIPIQTACFGENRQFVETNAEYAKGTTQLADGSTVDTKNTIFEDYDNKNYNLKSDSVVYKDIPSFEKLPDTKKIGVIVRDDLMKERYKMKDVQICLPASDIPVFLNGVYFQWTAPVGSAYYEFEIATDPEFKDVIVSENKLTTNSYTLDYELQPDIQYYWRVAAKSFAQSIDQTENSASGSFKTYTYEDAVKATVMDYSSYNSMISEYEGEIAYVVEDNGTDQGVGTYKAGTIAKLNGAIEESRKIAAECKLQSELNAEERRLNEELADIFLNDSLPYTRTYNNSLDEKDWKLFEGDGINSTLSVNKDELFFKSGAGCNYTVDMRPLSPKESVKVMVNFGDMKEWEAFAIRKGTDTLTKGGWILSGEGRGGYYIVVKQDFIELQRCPQIVGQIRVSVANNNEIIKPNTWHEIECSCETVNGESHVLFKVDGKTVIDYTSKDDAVEGLGYFGFMNNTAANDGIRMKPCK